ncbi:hypothetical protein [uncultured Sphingomonas sp.]|uniref:hypothetical protein n=1 Tax=uncultured Sphingomonas sp. TaxID=158754 RepID=UPI0026139214|nr:hypothetical protein [uncultured Sphingomonas sp.]
MGVNVTATGAAAAFAQPQLVNGTWELVQTAALPVVAVATVYALSITETNDGYANSPHTTALSVTMLPPSNSDVNATRGNVNVPPERLVTLGLVPSISNVTPLTTESAYTWKAPFGPTDRVGYAMDWSALLFEDDLIEDILAITVSPQGAALGVSIDTTTGRGPKIDTGGTMIGLHFRDTGDTTVSSFSGAGISVGISVQISTIAGDVLTRTAALIVRQL